MINLFDDQGRAVSGLRAKMPTTKAILLQSATGSGKTMIAASMIQGAVSKGTRSLMVVPRRELLRQTSQTYDKYGIQHTFISSGKKFNPFEKTMLATAGTLVKRMHDIPIPKVVFIDETHYGGAQLDAIIKFYKAAGCWVIGLSATPDRLDGKGLGCWYDDMVSGQPVDWLIENKRLSRYRMFAPDTPDMTGIRKTAGDYAKGHLAEKMEGDKVLVGNAVNHYREHAMGLLNVTFCVSVRHAEIVADAFNGEGIPAAAIHGKMNDAERDVIIRAFARRELLVLTSVSLLTFGFDLASAAQMDVTVECMSDLAPTESLAMQMQKWGRVLRLKDNPAIILDHAGNAERHGLPDEDREWSLADKVKGSMDGEKTAPIRQCPSCYFVHRPCPSCPECGFEYPVAYREIEEVDGNLKEIQTLAKKEARKDQGRAETLEDLKRIAKDTGKNPRWAQHVWDARQKKLKEKANMMKVGDRPFEVPASETAAQEARDFCKTRGLTQENARIVARNGKVIVEIKTPCLLK